MLATIAKYAPTFLKGSLSSSDRFLSSIIAGFASFFLPIQVTIIAVSAFIIVDAILGYKVSRKCGYKEVEANKIWKTINKLMSAALLICGAHTIDTFIVTSIELHAVEIVAGIICGTEFISWLESLKELHPRNMLVRIVEKVLGKVIKSKGERYLGMDIDIEEIKKEIK